MKRTMRVGLLCLGALLITVSGDALSGQEQTSPHQQELGQEAMNYIGSRFMIDPTILVPQTKKPLPMDGNWSVSPRTPANCPKINTPCVLVSYTVPATGIVCQWTVLVRGGIDRDFLVDLNENAALYLTYNPARKDRDLSSVGITGGHLVRSGKPVSPVKAPPTVLTRDTLKLLVRYDETGHPSEVKALAGPEDLRGSFEDAVKKWVYTPLEIDGVPISFRSLRLSSPLASQLN